MCFSSAAASPGRTQAHPWAKSYARQCWVEAKMIWSISAAFQPVAKVVWNVASPCCVSCLYFCMHVHCLLFYCGHVDVKWFHGLSLNYVKISKSDVWAQIQISCTGFPTISSAVCCMPCWNLTWTLWILWHPQAALSAVFQAASQEGGASKPLGWVMGQWVSRSRKFCLYNHVSKLQYEKIREFDFISVVADEFSIFLGNEGKLSLQAQNTNWLSLTGLQSCPFGKDNYGSHHDTCYLRRNG